MPTFKDNVRDEMDKLRTARDHLKVRLHLGQSEVKDVWAEAEVKWNRIEGELKRLASEVEVPTEELKHGIQQTLSELGEAYKRIKIALERE